MQLADGASGGSEGFRHPSQRFSSAQEIRGLVHRGPIGVLILTRLNCRSSLGMGGRVLTFICTAADLRRTTHFGTCSMLRLEQLGWGLFFLVSALSV